MNFKFWINLNENVAQNWDLWCDTLEKYSKNNPAETGILNQIKDMFFRVEPGLTDAPDSSLKMIIGNGAAFGGRIKHIIIQRVLEAKNIENYNWFSFSLGCLVSYQGHMRPEDLESAIDETKRRIDSRELPKSEIGAKGWLVIGSESKQHVDASIERSQRVSNREKERMRKDGRTLNENPNLVRIVAEEGDFTLYMCPKLERNTKDQSIVPQTAYSFEFSKDLVDERHGILCKYGKGGKFCTADATGTFHKMYVENDIYIFHIKDKVKYQFVSCLNSRNRQFMTVDNIPPENIDSEEYKFLIKHAPIECYDLKVDISGYEDIIDIIKLGKKDEIYKISLNNIEKCLVDAFSKKNLDDIDLFVNTGLLISRRESRSTRKFDLNQLIEKLEDDDFSQKIIKNLITKIIIDKTNTFLIKRENLISLFKVCDLRNLSRFILLGDNLRSILSTKDYVDLLDKRGNNQEYIEVLSKVYAPPITRLIAASKDVEKTVDLLRDKLFQLDLVEIVDLLLCEIRPTYGAMTSTRTYTREIILPKAKIKSTGREMGKILGPRVINRIPTETISEISSKTKTALFRDIELTTEKIKGFLEAIAMQHNNLSREDVMNIISIYKNLPSMHKGVTKITEMLGKKNINKLDKMDRWVLRM
jgi:hypothetical protein